MRELGRGRERRGGGGGGGGGGSETVRSERSRVHRWDRSEHYRISRRHRVLHVIAPIFKRVCRNSVPFGGRFESLKHFFLRFLKGVVVERERALVFLAGKKRSP